jgi:hypothetical protein
MARDFTKNLANFATTGGFNGVGQFLSGLGAISVACWSHHDTLQTTAASGNQILLQVYNSNNVSAFRFAIANSTAGNPVKVLLGGRSTLADGFQVTIGTTTVTTGSWVHAGGVLDIAGDNIRVYYNGAQEASTAVTFGATTYTNTVPTLQQDSIGFARTAVGPPYGPIATDQQVDGRIQELAVWNVDIATEGFRQLALGFKPFRVKPQNLILYWPLLSDAATLIELVKGAAAGMTINGSIPTANHNLMF